MITPQDEARIARAVRREIDDVGDSIGRLVFALCLTLAAVLLVRSYGIVRPVVIGLLVWVPWRISAWFDHREWVRIQKERQREIDNRRRNAPPSAPLSPEDQKIFDALFAGAGRGRGK
jgi:hypothetical protein